MVDTTVIFRTGRVRGGDYLQAHSAYSDEGMSVEGEAGLTEDEGSEDELSLQYIYIYIESTFIYTCMYIYVYIHSNVHNIGWEEDEGSYPSPRSTTSVEGCASNRDIRESENVRARTAPFAHGSRDRSDSVGTRCYCCFCGLRPDESDVKTQESNFIR